MIKFVRDVIFVKLSYNTSENHESQNLGSLPRHESVAFFRLGLHPSILRFSYFPHFPLSHFFKIDI